MGFYEERILPRIIDEALGKAFEETRARVAAPLEGDVLEVGFGSGRNVPHYPPAVKRVYAVEPASLGRRLAAGRVAASPVPVEYIGLDGQQLPLPDESVDHVLVTWTLCTIPDVSRALAETNRVLRPGGALHFVEHGRSIKPKVSAWQDRLDPVWGRLFGGCHLTRYIPDLVSAAGLELAQLEIYTGGPELFGTMFEGTAVKG